MEALQAELAKAVEKASSNANLQNKTLDALLDQLETLRKRIESADSDQAARAVVKASMASTSKLAKNSNTALQDSAKDYYNALNKFGKAVDKVTCLYNSH